MGMLDRFNDIIKANVNDLLDRMEDPGKMIDQYLRDLSENLAEVKKETAGVIAQETRAHRLVEENAAEAEKYAGLAKKALQAGNEGDARVFIAKQQQLETAGADLSATYAAARENAQKMRQMHDKLVGDIETLNRRREMIKAKMAVAKTQQKVNAVSTASDKAAGAMSAFDRMEEKAGRMLDEASAMAELDAKPVDEADALAEKYGSAGADLAVDDELERLKQEMGL